ncbi:MAG: hypothetical protein ACRCSU_16485 [Paracoccaceae bacterium]
MRVGLICAFLTFGSAVSAATVEPLYFNTDPADLVFTPPANGFFGEQISIAGTIAGSRNLGGLSGLAFSFSFNADFVTAALSIAGHTARASFNSALPFNHDDPRPADAPALDDASPFFLGHGEFFVRYPGNPSGSDNGFFDLLGLSSDCPTPVCHLSVRYAFDYYGTPPADGTVPDVSGTFWLPEHLGSSPDPAPVPLPAGGGLAMAALSALALLRRNARPALWGYGDPETAETTADRGDDANAFRADANSGVEMRIFAAG